MEFLKKNEEVFNITIIFLCLHFHFLNSHFLILIVVHGWKWKLAACPSGPGEEQEKERKEFPAQAESCLLKGLFTEVALVQHLGARLQGGFPLFPELIKAARCVRVTGFMMNSCIPPGSLELWRSPGRNCLHNQSSKKNSRHRVVSWAFLVGGMSYTLSGMVTGHWLGPVGLHGERKLGNVLRPIASPFTEFVWCSES